MRNKDHIPKACREFILFLDVLPRRYTLKIPGDVYFSIKEKQDKGHYPEWEGTITANSNARK